MTGAALHWIDWTVVGAYIAFALGMGLLLRKRASTSMESYFLSSRSLPAWVLGISMVATTFAADTPLVLSSYARTGGIWRNWIWWKVAITHVLAIFLFSRLWRRANVLTENEMIEIRYSGRPAAFLRGFKAFFFAVVYNAIVVGWVMKAISHFTEHLVGIDFHYAVLIGAGIATLYGLLSGMWGVTLTDLFQFAIGLVGTFALAIVCIRSTGGLPATIDAVREGFDRATLDLVPAVHAPDGEFNPAWGLFLLFVGILWWAAHNADGGGYIIQRMMAARNERDAERATMIFVLFHYVVRAWPWILTGLALLLLYPPATTDAPPEAVYVLAVRDMLPAGWTGVLIVAFLAAFMSTVDTHLNWGSSFLVHDLYRRFIRPRASERELLRFARYSAILLLELACLVAFHLESINAGWELILALGTGIGPVILCRWFWWRINAWSEIAALAASLVTIGIHQGLKIVYDNPAWDSPFYGGVEELVSKILLILVCSSAAWIWCTLRAGPEPQGTLEAFLRRVRPPGRWGPVRARAAEPIPAGSLGPHLPLRIAAGLAVVLGATFAVGNLLLLRIGTGLALAAVAVTGAVVLWRTSAEETPAT